jgi:hypothetical protein
MNAPAIAPVTNAPITPPESMNSLRELLFLSTKKVVSGFNHPRQIAGGGERHIHEVADAASVYGRRTSAPQPNCAAALRAGVRSRPGRPLGSPSPGAPSPIPSGLR